MQVDYFLECNKATILLSLEQSIKPPRGSLLEIASGSGQYILSYFAAHFPNIEFQPTEINRGLFQSINARKYNLPNLLSTKYLNVSSDPSVWLDSQLVNKQYDYILNINMLTMSV